MLNELGYDPDVIERQLAHRERNKIRAAYHRAEYLKERRDMMQGWADQVDRFQDADTTPSSPAGAGRQAASPAGR
jgi:hypothetical protein